MIRDPSRRAVSSVPGPYSRLQWILLALVGLSLVAGLIAGRHPAGSKLDRPAGAKAALAQVRQVQAGQVLPKEFESEVAKAAVEWKARPGGPSFDKALMAWSKNQRAWESLATEAASARGALRAGLDRASGPWAEAGREGGWASAEAVGWAQLQGAYQRLETALGPASRREGAIPPDLQTQAQSVAAAFEMFRNSPAAAQNTPLTRAWRDASAGWGQATPALNRLAAPEASAAWARRNAAAIALEDAYDQLGGTGAAAPLRLAQWFWVVLGLSALIGWVAVTAQQRRWQGRNAQGHGDQDDAALTVLAADLKRLGEGDLTHRAKASNAAAGVLAEPFNQAAESLGEGIRDIQARSADVVRAATRSREATGVLVDGQQQRLMALENGSQDVLQLIEAVGQAEREVGEAVALVEQVGAQVEAEQAGKAESLDRCRDLRRRLAEARTRADRLGGGSAQMDALAQVLRQGAEDLGVLGMQGALQASKAGEAGQGFRAVAKEMRDQSDRWAEQARLAASMADTARADGEAFLAILEVTEALADDVGRRADAAPAVWHGLQQNVNLLRQRTEACRSHTRAQVEWATGLDRRTRQELAQKKGADQQAEDAAAAAAALEKVGQDLTGAVGKFRA